MPEVPATRRSVLSSLASVFDPLGLLTPALVPAKLYFQTQWAEKRGWDEPIPSDQTEDWEQINNDWSGQVITIPRRVLTNEAEVNQFHIFVDASKDVYACCVYLRCHSKPGNIANIIYSKNRLRPRKTAVTIPRLELLAILIGVRAYLFVKNQIDIKCESGPVRFYGATPKLHWHGLILKSLSHAS